MKTYPLLLTLLVSLMTAACNRSSPEQEPATPDSPEVIDYYAAAHHYMERGDHPGALEALEEAFRLGFAEPMVVLQESAFQSLLLAPESRTRYRDLARAYSETSQATLVTAKEPGKRIFLTATVVDEVTGAPVPSARVELFQSDQSGLYFTEEGEWNPRLFGYLRTDSLGRFQIETIYPGRYRNDSGKLVPAHIHYSIQAKGYYLTTREFSFSNDSLILAAGNREQVPLAQLISQDSGLHYKVVLPLEVEE